MSANGKQSDPAKPTFQPLASRGERPAAITVGQEKSEWTDIYHLLLTMPWWAFLATMAVGYLVTNGLFALLYLAEPDGIVNARSGSFTDAFFFSVQTLATLGYGVMAPKGIYTNIVVTVEAFFSLVSLAIGTGLIFARFSRPTVRIVFSKVAVIAPFNGVPTLMLRAANQRKNEILDAEATVTYVHQITTAEGHSMRRFEELPLIRSRSPLFALSWTIMHPIDERSPLYGIGPERCAENQSEIIVVLSGVDRSYSERVHTRHSYLPPDIMWNYQFSNILSVIEGQRIVDYSRFHDVEPMKIDK